VGQQCKKNIDTATIVILFIMPRLSFLNIVVKLALVKQNNKPENKKEMPIV